MTIYIIRPEFTVQLGDVIFSGGEEVDLSEAEFEFHKHKLEGVGSSQVPEGQGNGITDDECCFPAPYFSSIIPAKIEINNTLDVEIKGSFFTPETTVLISGSTINNIEFLNSASLLVNLTAGNNPDFYDLTIDNGKESIFNQKIELFESTKIIVDLRSGGTQFDDSAIKMQSQMSFSRTADGMYFSGVNPWASWVKFVGDNNAWIWDRSVKKKLTLVFTNSGAFMLGIGSTETNENSNAQYYQAEILGYFTSSTAFLGFYANTGTLGNGTSAAFSRTIPSNSIKKLVIENNGEPGSTFSLYLIPSTDIADWSDESNLVVSGTIPSAMAADASQIMPFCIPRSSTFNVYTGFVLEEM